MPCSAFRKRIAPSSWYALPFLDEPARLVPAALEPVELEGDLPVPVDTEPLQRALDLLHRLGDLPARVGVLDSQQALAALPAGEEQ